jgi:lipid-A-disaccharide synthase
VTAVGGRRVVLTSNGPGELYAWARPVVAAWRRAEPDADVRIALVPCQFAAGHEAEVARGFDVQAVTTAAQFLAAGAVGRAPAGLEGGPGGLVLSLGGAGGHAVALARRLRVPAFKYAFVPYRAGGLERLFVHDEATRRKARLLGAPAGRVEVIGNLVADAVRAEASAGPSAAGPAGAAGDPHVLLLAGSRDAFAVHLIPFVLAVADHLAVRYPGARFVWPVPRLLRPETIAAGLAGRERATLGGTSAHRDGDRAVTEAGTVVELVDEGARYAHMHLADVAVTIPGTNTLELGIAGVPAVVVLPLNRPEIIPLEGPGHWLSLLPLVGTPLKRRAVRLFVERLDVPVALPNRFSGEPLMVEVKGVVDPEGVAARVAALVDDPDDRAHRRARLLATMPQPGAADRLVERVRALADARGRS